MDHSTDDLPIWTPAPNPWRTARQSVAALILLGLVWWSAQTLIAYLPPLSFEAANVPAARPVETPVGKPVESVVLDETPVVREPAVKPAVEVSPVVRTGPAVRTGPVVRDITPQETTH